MTFSQILRFFLYCGFPFLITSLTTKCSFLQVLWPEFSLWHLLAGVFYYQRHRTALDCLLEEGEQQVEQQQVEVVEVESSVAVLLGTLATKKEA